MLTELFASLLTWALELGPGGALALPMIGALAGTALFAGVYALRAQRLRRHAHDLLEAARRRIPREDEGRRAVVLGRLRAAPQGQTRSFADGREVAISSLMRVDGRIAAVRATRLAHGLVLETEDGVLPIHGAVHLERTREGARASADELASVGLDAAEDGPSARVLDARIGELVMVEGTLGRIERAGLREQAASLGFVSDTDDFGFVPIRMTALRLELPRATLAVAVAGVLAGLLVATPLPVGLMSDAPFAAWEARPHTELAHWVWRTSVVVGLLTPDRQSTLMRLAASAPQTSREEAWIRSAQAELGPSAPIPAPGPPLLPVPSMDPASGASGVPSPDAASLGLSVVLPPW